MLSETHEFVPFDFSINNDQTVIGMNGRAHKVSDGERNKELKTVGLIPSDWVNSIRL